MVDAGLTLTLGDDMSRIRVSCEHQNGLLYVVPAERSWVCSGDRLAAHALAGFFRALVSLRQPVVQDLMRQWGIYYREVPREGEQAAPADEDASV